VGVKLPTGREIDGKYLDENVKEFQKEIDKWKIEWNEFGATLMCDSWTGPTQKSISMTDWINITTLPTCLSTITMTRAEHVSIVK